MSKSNDTTRELRVDELENVSGGLGAANDVSQLSRSFFIDIGTAERLDMNAKR
jgi:hypothetical protein